MWTMAAALWPLSLTAPPAAELAGVFHTPSVVVACYWSELRLRQVRERRQALEEAKRAGDRRKVAELERWGREARTLARRHLAAKAPVGNVWEPLQPLLGKVAQRAGVDRVALTAPPEAETVDVTPHLLDTLQADAATRKIVDRLRRKPGKPGSL